MIELIGSIRYLGIKRFFEILKFSRIGKKAVRKAIEENRRLGLASPFEKDGKVYYKMPDGTITSENPFK